MTFSLAVCAKIACVDVLTGPEVALCVKYVHFFAVTLYTDRVCTHVHVHVYLHVQVVAVRGERTQYTG